MLRLSVEGLKDKSSWEDKNIVLPRYDFDEMKAFTKENPVWVHFGAGNIFRGFIARLQHQLLNDKKAKSGIIVAETFDYDIMDKIYWPYDNLALLVSLNPDGSTDKEIIASMAQGLKADTSDKEQMDQLKAVFKNPSLQMVSFTITEKGYALRDMKGDYLPIAEADFANGPSKARHAMSVLTALMYERFQAGAYPIALVSMDNCSHNGDKLKEAVLGVADEWITSGFAGEDFVSYLKDETKVSFPWSMIDKITPRPSEVIQGQLEEMEISDMQPVITNKNTFIAPFVNAEVPQYLVIEDKFPNGRPSLEKAGVYLTDRETVNNTEKMKVTTCLNPLHTALAVYGCLLGYISIASEMKDFELKALVEKIGYQEGMPVVVDPKILSPKAFIDEVIEKRLPNPFIPDTPQRIATDTSQKMAIRFGETIKSYMADPKLNAGELTFIPLAIAGWLRYLLGTDDKLMPMEVSSDPMLSELQGMLAGVESGRPETYKGNLKDILSNSVLFGVDLNDAGLSEKVEGMFLELIAGEDAVRNTLKKYLA